MELFKMDEKIEHLERKKLNLEKALRDTNEMLDYTYHQRSELRTVVSRRIGNILSGTSVSADTTTCGKLNLVR